MTGKKKYFNGKKKLKKVEEKTNKKKPYKMSILKISLFVGKIIDFNAKL